MKRFGENHYRVADVFDWQPINGNFIHLKSRKVDRGISNLLSQLKQHKISIVKAEKV